MFLQGLGEKERGHRRRRVREIRGVCDVRGGNRWGGGKAGGKAEWKAAGRGGRGSAGPRRRRGGRLAGAPSLPPGVCVPCSLVCTAGTGPSLAALALEAWGAEAGGGSQPVHTGAPIEARCWREEAVRGWVPCL